MLRWIGGGDPLIRGALASAQDALPKEGQIFARWSVSADAPAAGSEALGDRWLDDPTFS